MYKNEPFQLLMPKPANKFSGPTAKLIKVWDWSGQLGDSMHVQKLAPAYFYTLPEKAVCNMPARFKDLPRELCHTYHNNNNNNNKEKAE